MNDSNPESLPEPSSEAVSLDALFELLAEERRRYVLYQLADCDGDVCADELAERITASKTGVSDEDVSEAAFRSVATKLHHVDLPKLARAGLAEYDPDSRIVRDFDPVEPLDEWLEITRRKDGYPT